MKLLEELRAREQRAMEELARKQRETPNTPLLLVEHLNKLGIEARVTNHEDPESLRSVNPEGVASVGYVRVFGRHISQIDVNVIKTNKGKDWCFYYEYRIVTNVGSLEDELKCSWRGKCWYGNSPSRATPRGNKVMGFLLGDVQYPNLLSESLNGDSELVDKMRHLQRSNLHGYDDPYVHASREAGCTWIDGFFLSVCQLRHRDHNYEEVKPCESVTLKGGLDRSIMVSERRYFPTFEEIEVYDMVAKHIQKITGTS